jgi:hypothetical protein
VIINELQNPFFRFFDPVCQSNATRSTTGKNHIHEHTAQTGSRESQTNDTNSQKKYFSKKSSFVPIEILKPPLTRAYGNGTPQKNCPFFAKIEPKTTKNGIFVTKNTVLLHHT